MISLEAMKMEKNFKAVIEKGYPRMPYMEYPISNRDDHWNSLFGFVEREMNELKVDLRILEAHKRTREKGIDIPDDRMIAEQVHECMLEIADVSNTLDYLFEALLRLYLEARQ